MPYMDKLTSLNKALLSHYLTKYVGCCEVQPTKKVCVFVLVHTHCYEHTSTQFTNAALL